MFVPQIAPFLDNEEYEAIKSCFDNNWITEGPKANLFLEELKKLLKVKYAVFAPNATLGLYMSLKAAGIKPGDEVLVPDFTFVASANSVEMAGGIPIFCDVNNYNFQIDVVKCKKLITDKTRAIMPVHMYGMSVNMNEVKRFAEEYNLVIIEDAAQALAIEYSNYIPDKSEISKTETRMAGTFGDVGCFSFYADKTITTGEGGLIVTNNAEIFENLCYIRNHGRLNAGTFVHDRIGYNLRITDMQAAMGLVQLKKLSVIIKRKLEILEAFKDGLKNVDEVKFLELEKFSNYIPFRIAILAKNSRDLMSFLSKQEIQPRSFFYPLHNQPSFQVYQNYSHPELKLDDSEYENAVYAYNNGICLPAFPTLSNEQISFICEKIKEYYVRQ